MKSGDTLVGGANRECLLQLQRRMEQMKKSLDQQTKELDDRKKAFEKEREVWEDIHKQDEHM